MSDLGDINNNYDLFIGTLDNISVNDFEVSQNAISDFRITFTYTNVFDKLYYNNYKEIYQKMMEFQYMKYLIFLLLIGMM